MNKNVFVDICVSNLIVIIAYFFVGLFWLYCFNNLGFQIQLLFNFPYGIFVLSFLFFGNKVILGLLLAKICIYFFSLNYDFVLPFKDYFILSFIQLVCVPITLFALERFNYTVGTGKNYKLDKTNIYHVLLICFLSAILNFIFNIFYDLFFIGQVYFLLFSVGCFFGSVVLIVLIKVLVNIPYMLKKFKIFT